MAETSNQTTLIASDTHITGQMSFERSARIVGKFDGKITAKGELQVADGAVCKAEVEAQTVTIDGEVQGNVVAREKVQLNAKARVSGDITAEKLVVAEGASFFGNCSVGPEAVKGAKKSEGVRPAVVQPQPQMAEARR